MTFALFMAAIVGQLFMVAGQLVMKRSMLLTNRTPMPRRRFAMLFAVAVGAMTIYFFLWLGLMQKIPLSQQYPFDAVAPLMLVLGATVFLKERLSFWSWLGIILFSAGIGVISFS